MLLGQILERRIEAESVVCGEAVQKPAAPAIAAVAQRGRDERSLVQGSLRIGHEQRRMHPHRRADARARWAGARRVVERELGLVHLAGDKPMPGAAETVVKLLVLAAKLLRLHDVKAEQAVSEFQSVLQRSDDLLIDSGADDERIDHGFDRMSLVFIEFDMVPQVARLAVDPRPPVAVDADLLEQVLVILAVNLVDRRPHLDLGAFRQGQQMFHHLMRGANRERLAAQRAVRRPHRGEQHPQVVGDVGHRADRRAGIGADGFLIDGHDRRQAVDEIDVRLFQLPHESFGERRHRRQQTPLPFGIDRVEGERRLAGPAHAGDDDQLVARNLHVDVLQVVLPRPVNLDGRSHIRAVPFIPRSRPGVT